MRHFTLLGYPSFQVCAWFGSNKRDCVWPDMAFTGNFGMFNLPLSIYCTKNAVINA